MHYRDRIPLNDLKLYAAALNTRAKALRCSGSLTAETLRGVILDSGGRCAWCGDSLIGQAFEIDHIMPLSRGGDNLTVNLVLACADCNRRKGDKPPLTFAQQQSARGKLTRLVRRLLKEADAPAMRQDSLFGEQSFGDDAESPPSGWVYTPPEE